MVMSGIRLFLKAWPHTTLRSDRPLARAVLTKSWPITSSSDERVIRMKTAAAEAGESHDAEVPRGVREGADEIDGGSPIEPEGAGEDEHGGLPENGNREAEET